MKILIRPGERYARLVVVSQRTSTTWLCRCDCGRVVVVLNHKLKAGHKKSCGCFQRDARILTHTKHGLCGTPEYRSWQAMLTRCTNPNTSCFKYYGGRGITVCERWLSFENFLADMGRKPTNDHSIDRYPNNDGNYEKSNCRWATRSQQVNNSRRWKGKTRLIPLGGIDRTIASTAQLLNMKEDTLRNRLRKGWSVEKATSTPVVVY